jgi:hypothetical protein
MPLPDSGALRLARATGLGLSAFALSLMAHVAAGGNAPSATASAVMLSATVWVSIFLTRRRLNRPTMVAAIGSSQVVLHQLFSLTTGAGTCMTVVHSHADHLTNGAVTVCSQGSPAMAHHDGSSALMTAAHVVAAVAIGLVLARGEAALWFLAGLVWPRVPDLPKVPAFGVPAAAPLVAQWTVRPRLGIGNGDRRGPPAAVPSCPTS